MELLWEIVIVACMFSWVLGWSILGRKMVVLALQDLGVKYIPFHEHDWLDLGVPCDQDEGIPLISGCLMSCSGCGAVKVVRDEEVEP